LDRGGELAVLIGLLEDHRDYLQEEITRRLSVPIAGEPKELAALQADQGALREVGKIASAWLTLARAPEPMKHTPDPVGRRLVNMETGKRARVRF